MEERNYLDRGLDGGAPRDARARPCRPRELARRRARAARRPRCRSAHKRTKLHKGVSVHAVTMALVPPAGGSFMPPITLFQRDGVLSTHSQYHGRHRHLLETDAELTRANTQPMRVKLDFASLYEETAPEYSACFAVGDWFRRGLPSQQTPPAVETCQRGAAATASLSSLNAGCWGRCTAEDVIQPADRERLEQVVTTLAAELTTLFAVRRGLDQLTFEVSRGDYERALQSRGYDVPESCASDCRVLSNVAVDPRYCDAEGGLAHGFDAVVSVTKPPTLHGVAGTGSACAFDETRRPLWLVLAWHSSIVGLSSSGLDDAVRRHRAFVRHELLHGLGFVNSMFFYARHSGTIERTAAEPLPHAHAHAHAHHPPVALHALTALQTELGKTSSSCERSTMRTVKLTRSGTLYDCARPLETLPSIYLASRAHRVAHGSRHMLRVRRPPLRHAGARRSEAAHTSSRNFTSTATATPRPTLACARGTVCRSWACPKRAVARTGRRASCETMCSATAFEKRFPRVRASSEFLQPSCRGMRPHLIPDSSIARSYTRRDGGPWLLPRELQPRRVHELGQRSGLRLCSLALRPSQARSRRSLLASHLISVQRRRVLVRAPRFLPGQQVLWRQQPLQLARWQRLRKPRDLE